MNSLKIQQGSNAESVSTNIIQTLYYSALSVPQPQSGQIDNALLSGHITAPHAYKYQINYLAGIVGEGTSGVVTSQRNNSEGRFSNLQIDIVNGYYVEIEDPIFKSAVAQVMGDGTNVTEAQAASYTGDLLQNVIIKCSNTNIKNIDLTPFTNATFRTSYNNKSEETLQNVILDTFNFGSQQYLTANWYGYYDTVEANFNSRIATDSYAEIVIGENVKVIGDFAFRGLITGEMYFPNVEWLGKAIGSAKATISGTQYNRKFIFLGSKLECMSIPFADENVSNNGIIVITNPIPPRMGEFDIRDFTEQTALVSNNLYKFAAYDYYVPDDALATYKAANNWKDIEPRNAAGHIYPISQLPDEYKAKIAKWYVELSS